MSWHDSWLDFIWSNIHKQQTVDLTWAEQSCSSEQGVFSLRHPQRCHTMEEVKHRPEEIVTASCSHRIGNGFLCELTVFFLFSQDIRYSSECRSGFTWVVQRPAVHVFLWLYVSQTVVCRHAVELQGWRQEKKSSIGCKHKLQKCVCWFIHLDSGLLGFGRSAELRAGTWPPVKTQTRVSSGLKNPGGQNLWGQQHYLFLYTVLNID